MGQIKIENVEIDFEYHLKKTLKKYLKNKFIQKQMEGYTWGMLISYEIREKQTSEGKFHFLEVKGIILLAVLMVFIQ